MRHRKRGRRLGRSSSHRKALLKNLASALLLTERDDMYYEGLFQSDGVKPVNPPAQKGRIVTTVQKAKEVRPLIEKCITIARKGLKHIENAEQFETEADRQSDEWKSWRKSDEWQKWNQAISPALAARRHALRLLGDKEAVSILFDEVAPRFTEREGGYTRILKLAKPRLGDAGAQALLEFVGVNDRLSASSQKPAFGDDAEDVTDEEVTDEKVTDEDVSDEPSAETADEAVAEGGQAEEKTE